jgi:hypothetical protein
MNNKYLIISILAATLLGFFYCPPKSLAADTDIVISEIGAYETSDNEWLEIYNKGSEPVNLTGWKFYENSTNHGLTIKQGDFIIEAGEYALIANKAESFLAKYPDYAGTLLDSTWSSLNEAGEEIGLKNSSGEIIEIFTYLSCPDTSLQRIDLNWNDYTAANWQVHATDNSAGYANEFMNEEPPAEPDPGTDPADEDPVIPEIAEPGSVLINEFVSDPVAGQKEWIELYNRNSFNIDLTDWSINDGSGAATALSGMIGTKDDNPFFVVELTTAKLNNAGDIIILKNSQDQIMDAIKYGDWEGTADNAPAASDPNSTARLLDGLSTGNPAADFAVTQTPTKNKPNKICNLEHSENNTDEEQPIVKVSPAKENYKNKITISEIFPNPAGPDAELEYIELKNLTGATIDLSGWQLENSAKVNFKINSQAYKVTNILPGGYFVISRSISGLALKNDQDTLKLISPDNKLIQTIKYQEDPGLNENASFALDKSNDWHWTTSLTRGTDNIITLLNHPPIIEIYCPQKALINEVITCDASDSYDLENNNLSFTWQINNLVINNPIVSYQFSEKGSQLIRLIISDGSLQNILEHKITILSPTQETQTAAKTSKKTSTKTTSASTKKNQNIGDVLLATAKTVKINSKLTTHGIVTVLPNTFSKNIMYINGLQLYMYKADWPKLNLGDLIDISGTIAETKGERRLKLTTKESMQVIGQQPPPIPIPTSLEEIGEEMEGYLVQTEGQLFKKEGQIFFLQNQNAEGQVVIKKNTKINSDQFQINDQLRISGIVSQNDRVYQLLPRSNEDIVKINSNQQDPADLILTTNSKSTKVLYYLLTATAVTSTGVLLLFTKNKKS